MMRSHYIYVINDALRAPASEVSRYLDLIGSVIVATYLGYSGLKIIIEKRKRSE